MVISLEKCREIERVTGFPFVDAAVKAERERQRTGDGSLLPLMTAIAKAKTNGQLDTTMCKGLFVVSLDRVFLCPRHLIHLS